MILRRALLAAALAASAASAARAELVLEGLHWQVGRVEQGRVASWQDVKVLKDGPPRLDNRLRARVVLKNRGPRPMEGILLRYSLTARLTARGGEPDEGSWAIPFAIDEKRVPLIEPNKILDVHLDVGGPLALHLRRLASSGWWPDRVRLQVMIEPHPGVKALQTNEDTLEIGP